MGFEDLSLSSRFAGGLLCLAGGYVIGYGSGDQSMLGGITTAIDGAVNSTSFLKTIADQLSSIQWYAAVGGVLFLLGSIVILRGGGRSSVPRKTQQRQVNPGTCKFCGADMKGSTTYCPRCGRSQI